MSPLGVWILAARLKTLSAAIIPVLLGIALASRSVSIDWPIAICILFSAVAIQIGTNLANDYADFKSGADTSSRQGPTRVTQAGLLSPVQVKRGANIAFAIAFLFGIPLIMKGGILIAVIGIIGIACGWLYTSGPYPLGYNGLGELFVILFFGFAAVMGTIFLLTGSWTLQSAIIATVPGCHAAALLAANNLRDMETDRKAGKHTLAVRFGQRFARIEYAFLLLIPFVVPVILWLAFGYRAWVLTPLFSLQGVFRPLGIAFKSDEPSQLGVAFFDTAKLLVIFGILLTLSIKAA